ncbi:restriction endonuclease subunit S [Ruminococcus bromii]|uniref:restriction endonuclease subunit S n=1 Tax=Ruminococcus bromii TaxID=40518 RepID=UPI00399BEB16
MKFNRYALSDLATIKYGKNQKKVLSENGNIPIYGTGGLMGYATTALYDKPSVLIGRKGTIGKVKYVEHPFWTVDTLFYTIVNTDIVLPKYLYYVMSLIDLNNYNEGTTIPSLRTETLNRLEFDIPSLVEQETILSCLNPIDEKIALNNAINNNLLEQVLTLYRNKFVDTANNERAICRADEYFDISIGKTPPRKEPQWFSTNLQDVTWVSISDMGTCGLYISSSSEQLTKQAVERHNVKVVPDNTVLLSFKLTVGRIAITNGEMTTNEAIAHFKTDKKEINEYLYCYLKCFNYQTMGSTSSIATAVNSKIIKGMPFVVPTNDELEEFHGFAAPMFAKIKANQIETDNLTALRDTLLPKLMSGELDVSEIEI